eukprot:1160022-Pelagomonas_calceolata.AAC.4
MAWVPPFCRSCCHANYKAAQVWKGVAMISRCARDQFWLDDGIDFQQKTLQKNRNQAIRLNAASVDMNGCFT